MGIFQNLVEVVNRAPEDITITFDGQCKTLTPGTNHIPRVTVDYGKNQNPIMGSQSPYNPHISGAKYLIGVVGEDTPEDCEPLTAAEWADHLGQPQRENAQLAFEDKYGGDPKAKLVVRGRKGKPAAASVYEAGRGAPGSGTFENDK